LASGRRSTARTTLKIAALAPIPRASVNATVIHKEGTRARERTAIFKSRKKDISDLRLNSSAHLFLAGEKVLATSGHGLKCSSRSISINVTEWFPSVNTICHKTGDRSSPQ
jgi:hypothetical protein